MLPDARLAPFVERALPPVLWSKWTGSPSPLFFCSPPAPGPGLSRPPEPARQPPEIVCIAIFLTVSERENPAKLLRTQATREAWHEGC